MCRSSGGLNLNSCAATVILTPHFLRAMTLSRPLFEAACKAFVRHRHGWVWIEHAASPGFGYMHRTTPLQKRSATSDLPELVDGDPAAAIPSPDHLTCHQSVVYSPTFQVPTFYFSVNDSSA